MAKGIVKSRTKCGNIRALFASHSPEERKLRVQVARISVLYEDLQLELEGSIADSIPALDSTSLNTRRFYFVRRTLATIIELSGAFHLLNQNMVIKKWKPTLPKDHQKQWDQAVKWFSAEHKVLNGWRNDLGGHFHDDAAAYAIDNVGADEAGCIELYLRGNGADARIKFASELVATAMMKGSNTGKRTEHAERLFELMFEAQKHARAIVQMALGHFVFERLK